MEAGQATSEGKGQETEPAEDGAQQVQQTDQPAYVTTEETSDQEQNESSTEIREGRSNFIHGLSVGLGIGCIATFVIMWITIFFTPQMPSGTTYENLLSIFIYPLIYLLAVGLIALTAGIVREYYAIRR